MGAARGNVVRAGEDIAGRSIMLGGDRVTLKVRATDTAGAFALFHYEGRARGGPPLHVHPDQDEMFSVERGDYRFRCGDEEFRLGAGDTIFLPRGVPHTFAQDSETGALLFMFTPAGTMEDFFLAAAQAAGPPKPEAAAMLFGAHGMQVVGAPLSLDDFAG